MSRLREFVKVRRENQSRGAALVEFALVLPLLIALFIGIVDFGEAWFNSTSVQTGVRSASVVGFDAGNEDFQHDRLVIDSIIRELDGRGFDEIVGISIYDADNPDISDTCFDIDGSELISGVEGQCNIYGAEPLSKMADGDFAGTRQFDAACTDGQAGSWWCYRDRGKVAPGGAPIAEPTFNVGVQVTVRAEALIGFFPFFQEYTLTKTSVIPEITERDSGTTP